MLCWYLSNNPTSKLLYMYFGEYFSLVLLKIIFFIIVISWKQKRNDNPSSSGMGIKNEKKNVLKLVWHY